MPYLTPTFRVIFDEARVAEDGTITVVVPTALVDGRAIVVTLAGVDSGSQSVLMNSISDGVNTYNTPTNVRAGTDYVPNASMAVALDVAAGTPTISIGVDKSTGVAANVCIVEAANVLTSSAIEVIKPGEGAGDDFTLTEATGALSQDAFAAVMIAAGWFGNAGPDAGWFVAQDVPNGSGPGYVGSLVQYRAIASAASFQGRVEHPDASTANVSALMVLLKAAASGTNLRIKILLDPATFLTGEKPFDILLWRNGQPDAVLARRVTIADVASPGVLYVSGSDLPWADLSLSDSIGAYVNGATRYSGIVPAIVESY